MNYNDYNILKNMSFEEVILMIINNNSLNIKNDKNYDVYYTSKQLIELYPNVFSKYKIDKYIKNENLPVIKDGKERLFLKSNIEKWLQEKNDYAIFKGAR